MPVQIVRDLSVGVLVGGAPGAPTAVTSITKDSGAIVSFLAPADQGLSSITHYIVTPYVGATPQSPTTIAVGSLGTITGSNGSTYRQADLTGLTNDTEYTFTVKARNSNGDSVASVASGANTPRAGLVFGDEFNGSLNGFIDPEHWLLNVSSLSDESDYYRPDHVYLDGAGNIVLKSSNTPYGGKDYTSGCFQNNVRNFFPTSGNTLTFETRAQVCAEIDRGMWPAPWLSGTGYQQSFKTNQNETNGWDNNLYAEIDYAEWYQTGSTSFLVNTWASSSPQSDTVNTGVNLSAAQHIYRVDYKPNSSCKYYFDGTLKFTHTNSKPIGAMFHMWFQQIPSSAHPGMDAYLPVYTYIDYLRIYDRNLG